MMRDYTKKYKRRQREEGQLRQMASLIEKQLLLVLILRLSSAKKRKGSSDTKGERTLTS
jgi:hypothetical protein